ncbi:hypothetical protein AOXY_G20058 [Acipenser oxyrinchus oxyrinchus]|uniref:Uncharacterized protein n=1 Tax=Acipenser oxyrinchus oxyrinchus TaxID=40147 RepID=A0AAD8D006_ACIOX|nr:hypothetical protein AOXY_G20058 [Acipenser oxyrinchus oxyrinchus]
MQVTCNSAQKDSGMPGQNKTVGHTAAVWKYQDGLTTRNTLHSWSLEKLLLQPHLNQSQLLGADTVNTSKGQITTSFWNDTDSTSNHITSSEQDPNSTQTTTVVSISLSIRQNQSSFHL